MRIAVVARNIGLVLLLNALFMLIAVVVSMLYGFDKGFTPLLFSAAITAIIGSLPFVFTRKQEEITIREGYVIAVFSWLFSCLFGMIPYLLSGGEFSWINAWYESVSGFTTTGGTVLTNIEALPHSLLFWRASTQWIGGIGVILFVLLIFPQPSTIRLRLSRIEMPAFSQDTYRFKAKETVRVIAFVYFGLTLLETLLLSLAGMNVFDAICHSFTTISTGGLSTKNAGLSSYDNVAIETIVMVFMVVSSLHFGMIFLFITGKSISLLKSPVTRYYIFSTLLIGLLISLNLWVGGTYNSLGTSLRHGLFQTFSLVSTTGFSSSDTSLWPNFSLLLLFFMIFQGGCSGSTAGGIKADRMLISFHSIRAQITKRLHPRSVVQAHVGGQTIDLDVTSAVNLFIVLSLLVFFVVALLLTAAGIELKEALSASIAHLSNVGPGFGSVGPMSNYSALNGFSKFVLSLTMIIGRKELFGFFILFASGK